MDTNIQIKEGLEIAVYSDGRLIGIKKVERVTATQLVLTTGVKLRHNLSVVGGETYSSAYYAHVTPAIREEYTLKRSRAVVAKKLEELNAAVKTGDLAYITSVFNTIKGLVPQQPA